MADTERTRRFRPRPSGDTAAHIGPVTPPGAWQQPRPRPAPVQAKQDVVDVAAFIRKVETERSQGQPAPRPQPMQNVLGAFRGSPGTQTTVQVLAAAATARHFGGEHSAAARKWAKLAQDNAARLDAMRAQQYRQEQARYVQAQMPPEEIDRRMAERVAADHENDRRAFDAAGALALSYVAVKSLPPFDKLAELSREHLTAVDLAPVPEPTVEAPQEVGRYPDDRVEGEVPDLQTEEATEETGVDLDKSPDGGDATAEVEQEIQVETAIEAVEDADVSDRLKQVAEPAQRGGRDLGKLGSVLEAAGRSIATAIGPVHSEDEVAPLLSPVDLNQLSQELLSALGAAVSSHPRSVTEMLNVERQPDHNNEAAFVPDMGSERRQETTLGY